MNRDEILTRKAERAPYIWDNGIMAPQDTESGGTWIGINPKNNQWACLLNGYSESDKTMQKSRGEIIPLFLSQESPFPFPTFEIENYNSFHLLYGDNITIRKASWNGKDLTESKPELENGWLFQSSSSWEQEAVINYRKNRFKNWQESSNQEYVTNTNIPVCHTDQEEGKESFSTLMRRNQNHPDERATTSITTIKIEPSSAKMDYFSSQRADSKILCALKRKDIFKK